MDHVNDALVVKSRVKIVIMGSSQINSSSVYIQYLSTEMQELVYINMIDA